MAKAVLPLVCCCTLISVSVASGQPRASEERTAQVDAIFKEYAKNGSPGCAVGVYKDDRVVYSGAYGMANLDHDVPLTTVSVFHVASLSKQFTAAAILLLVAGRQAVAGRRHPEAHPRIA